MGFCHLILLREPLNAQCNHISRFEETRRLHDLTENQVRQSRRRPLSMTYPRQIVSRVVQARPATHDEATVKELHANIGELDAIADQCELLSIWRSSFD